MILIKDIGIILHKPNNSNVCLEQFMPVYLHTKNMICKNEINAASSLDDKATIIVDFGNRGPFGGPHFLPLVAALVNCLLPAARPLTVSPS